jgi:hypothetical protein
MKLLSPFVSVSRANKVEPIKTFSTWVFVKTFSTWVLIDKAEVWVFIDKAEVWKDG